LPYDQSSRFEEGRSDYHVRSFDHRIRVYVPENMTSRNRDTVEVRPGDEEVKLDIHGVVGQREYVLEPFARIVTAEISNDESILREAEPAPGGEAI
jgi:hypothetical protein